VPVERRQPDGSWGRLAWTLPVALILTMLALAGFLDVLSGGVSPPSASEPVSVQIVELPPEPSQVEKQPTSETAPPSPVQPPSSPQTPPVLTVPLTPPPPNPAPPIKAPPPPKPAPPKELPPPLPDQSPPAPQTPPASPALPTPPPPPPQQQARKPKPAHTQLPLRRDQSRQPPQDQTASPMAGAPAQAQPSASVTRSPAGGITMGARALYRPMPDIPEELRHRELAVVAIARFHVAADGSATVTLLQATADPRLNAALMSALQKWRFFPAMDNGRPIASTIDIRVPIEVR
jgi:periplasmic protein TonB